MNPIDPGLEESMGHDALTVWVDFWELTGRMRVDIRRSTESGGDPSKMISPVKTVTTISGAPAVLVGKDIESVTDRSGEIPSGSLQLELIDHVYVTDRLIIYGMEHEISQVTEKDMGGFSIWIVKAKPVV